MAEDDRPERGGCGHEGLQAPGPADPVAREAPHPLRDLGGDRGDRVVVVRLDPDDPRRLGCPEAGGLGHPERDRDLPEDVTGPPLADHALDTVDDLDRLDPPFEQGEQCGRVAVVDRVLAGAEGDVGRDATEPLEIGRLECREHGDTAISSGVTMRGTSASTPSPRGNVTAPVRALPGSAVPGPCHARPKPRPRRGCRSIGPRDGRALTGLRQSSEVTRQAVSGSSRLPENGNEPCAYR